MQVLGISGWSGVISRIVAPTPASVASAAAKYRSVGYGSCPVAGLNSAVAAPGGGGGVEPAGLPLLAKVLVGVMVSLWLVQPPNTSATARIPAAVRYRISLELLSCQTAGR